MSFHLKYGCSFSYVVAAWINNKKIEKKSRLLVLSTCFQGQWLVCSAKEIIKLVCGHSKIFWNVQKMYFQYKVKAFAQTTCKWEAFGVNACCLHPHSKYADNKTVADLIHNRKQTGIQRGSGARTRQTISGFPPYQRHSCEKFLGMRISDNHRNSTEGLKRALWQTASLFGEAASEPPTGRPSKERWARQKRSPRLRCAVVTHHRSV